MYWVRKEIFCINLESNNVKYALILGKWKFELSIHRPEVWDFCQLWRNNCYLSADTTKVSSFFTHLQLIINIFLEVKLYWFPQNYQATFLNKDLICEKMKPWQQWMACFPLHYRHGFLSLPWMEFAAAVPAQAAHLQKLCCPRQQNQHLLPASPLGTDSGQQELHLSHLWGFMYHPSKEGD